MQITYFKDYLNSATTGYLLIEPANLPVELQEFLPAMRPCVPPFLWAAENSMPQLLSLDKLSDAQQKAIDELLAHEASATYPPSVFAWLHSSKGIEEIASGIGRLISGTGPDGNKVIWRFYDPRVFILAMSIFKDDQVNVLLGTVESWTFPWHQHWWRVHRTKRFSPSPHELELGWPNSSQWNVLIKSGIFNSIFSRNFSCDVTPEECLDNLSYSIKAFLETENYLHLESDEDRAEFVYLSIRYRKHFRNIYDLAISWEQLKARQITLREMLLRIEQQDIQYIEKI